MSSNSKDSLSEIEATAQYDLRYYSRRGEVWSCYWRQWISQLSSIHALTAMCIVCCAYMLSPTSLGVRSLALIFLLATATFSLLSTAWTQLKFKSAERVLKVGPEGYTTRIGHVTGARTWTEIASIKQFANVIAITGKNGNSILVPRRAFTAASDWDQFLADLRTWQSARG